MKSKSSASRIKRSRRPKFLSLRRQITAATAEMTPPPDEGNVADRFFKGEEGCATTLTGLLQPEKEEEAAAAAESPMSSLSAAYSVDGRSLVRAAMRSREREVDDGEKEEEEVRWVRMSEVVSEEVSSRAAEEEEGEREETRWLGRRREVGAAGGRGGLALKLDYKEVEEAWDGCGKGRPFFSWPDGPDSSSTIEGPQIVPDLRIQHDDFFYHHDLNAANGVLWGVPDQKSCFQHGAEENGDQSIEGWRLGKREASVLRYREKRMNRLFSKRIRYQVRKLNAEKRPRVKGRFVKRS